MIRHLLPILAIACISTACTKGRPAADNTGPSVDEMAKDPAAKFGHKQSDSANQFPTLPEERLKGIARTSFDSPNPTPAQLARRATSIATLKKLKLPHLDTLPVVEDETTVRPRDAQEVAKRCLATTICAVKGESNDQELVEDLIARYKASKYFSANESRFIKNHKPEQQQLIDHAWQYECVHVFLWALTLRDDIMEPNKICPVKDDVGRIKKIAPAEFVSKAKLRPTSEILDMADLYYHLHWAAIEVRIKGKKNDAVDEEIIRERHRALNWLIRYLNQEWDDVTTDT